MDQSQNSKLGLICKKCGEEIWYGEVITYINANWEHANEKDCKRT